MPNSLKARLKKLKYQGVLSQEDIDRIVILPNAEKATKNETTMTNEEAIARIKEHMIIHKMEEPRAIHISEALNMAIKALEQIDILGKIKEEVKLLSNANPSYWHSGDMVEREEVLEIIDKYKKESEDEE